MARYTLHIDFEAGGDAEALEAVAPLTEFLDSFGTYGEWDVSGTDGQGFRDWSVIIGRYCWCGHTMDKHRYPIAFERRGCESCLLDDETGEANPDHAFERIGRDGRVAS